MLFPNTVEGRHRHQAYLELYTEIVLQTTSREELRALRARGFVEFYTLSPDEGLHWTVLYDGID